MVDLRNIAQRNLSHSCIRWTTGHWQVVPGNSQLQLSIIGSDMPSALGLVLYAIRSCQHIVCVTFQKRRLPAGRPYRFTHFSPTPARTEAVWHTKRCNFVFLALFRPSLSCDPDFCPGLLWKWSDIAWSLVMDRTSCWKSRHCSWVLSVVLGKAWAAQQKSNKSNKLKLLWVWDMLWVLVSPPL